VGEGAGDGVVGKGVLGEGLGEGEGVVGKGLGEGGPGSEEAPPYAWVVGSVGKT
jgi:hypothetical protein